MENEAAAISDQEYREMDRGGLLLWLGRIEQAREGGQPLPVNCTYFTAAWLALDRLGGLMGEW